MPGFFYSIDPLYWMLLGPAILLALVAQVRVSSTFSRYARVGLASGLSGAEAAMRILGASGLGGVRVEVSRGWLSDHYDPRARVLRLSPGVYSGRSVSAVGVAAHEAGHALQHAQGYAPMGLRNAMVPAAGLGSWLAWPMIFFGFILNSLSLVQVGIALFAALVVFQVVTLPVEFNASARARAALVQTGIIATPQEDAGVRSVLGAAAFTYVAATMAAILQLLYFMLRAGMLGGRDE